MKFSIEHTFQGVDRPSYEKLYFDEPFNVALCEAVNLDRELLKREETDGRLVREVKVAPRGRQIPAPIAKFMGGARIEYVEKIDYEFGAYRGEWQSISSLMTDKIRSQGTFRIEEAAAGVRRIVEGEISVKIFGVGKAIEGYVVDDIKRSYSEAAEFTRTWIAQRA